MLAGDAVVMLAADQAVDRAVVRADVVFTDDDIGQRESLSQRFKIEQRVEMNPQTAVAAPGLTGGLDFGAILQAIVEHGLKMLTESDGVGRLGLIRHGAILPELWQGRRHFGMIANMSDMLVNLLKLPSLDPLLVQMRKIGVNVRRAQPFELTKVRKFIEKEFSVTWADEASVGFARQPISVIIATRKEKVIGFAAYECTRRCFFGPEGVAKKEQGKGIGKVLLIASLYGLRNLGYGYAIIGSAGPVHFYEKTVGATLIPDSSPGIYGADCPM
jgi:hypothetical protein